MPRLYDPIPNNTSDDQKWAIVNKNFATLDNQVEKSGLFVIQEGTLTLPVSSLNTGGAVYASTGQEVTTTHPFGYSPIILAYWGSDDGGYGPLPATGQATVTSTGFIQYEITAYATPTQVGAAISYFGYNANAGLGEITVKYYLLQKTAN